MEVSDMRTQSGQQFSRFLVIRSVGAVRIFADIVQYGGENLGWYVQERDTAFAQLGEVFRFENRISSPF